MSESIKVPKFHNENYCRMTSDLMDTVTNLHKNCRMTSDLMDDAQEDVRWMLGGCQVVVPMISNKYPTNIKLITKL